MKKLLPFVFPVIALLIVIFLAVRWYNSRVVHSSDTQNKIAQFGDGVKIEDLSPAEADKLKQPAKDEKSVELTGAPGVTGVKAEVRYEIKDGKLNFSVIANLPKLVGGTYAVWLKQVDGDAKKKAFTLVDSKGGYIGSAAVSADMLPFEVIISKDQPGSDLMGDMMLSGVIQKESN